MAAVTHGQSLATTTNGTVYTTASFTPAAGDLLVVFVGATASLDDGVVTDSLGGTYTFGHTAIKNASADEAHLFIANQFASGAAMTITFTCAADAATGCFIIVARVSGMLRTGLTGARRQSAGQNNQAASTTPAPAFAAACLTGNPTLGFVFNATNPAGMTPPSGWTEPVADLGFAQPTSGAEYVTRDSGFTGTTITWGSTSPSAYCDIIVELDASAPVALQDPIGGGVVPTPR